MEVGGEVCSRNGNLHINQKEIERFETFEERIYWSYFKSMRFYVTLSPHFLSLLMLPKKFSDHLRNKLRDTVVLKGPGGSEWEVKVLKDNNYLYFGQGWEVFAKAHNLKENDVLFFKYKRESCFKMWVLNSKNSCEEASSYFVRKTVVSRNDAGESSQLNKKKTRENNVEHDDGVDAEEETASIKKSRRQTVCGLTLSNNAEARTATTTPQSAPVKELKQVPSGPNNDKALEMAENFRTDDCFIVGMKAHNVSHHYSRLFVRASWARVYLEPKNQDMELHRKGSKWRVRYNTQSKGGGGAFVSGWSKFVVDNELQESDVCVFTLASQKGEPAIFQVRIIRADDQNSSSV